MSESAYIELIRNVQKQITQGQFASAFDDLEVLLQKSENSWMLLYLAGLSCFGLAEFRQALIYFEQADREEPNRYPSAVAISACHLRLGRLADGLFYQKISMTLEQRDEDQEFLLPMMNFYTNLALYHEDSALIRGKFLLKEGLYVKAHQELEDFSTTKDPSAELFEHLILLGQLLGQYHQAIQWSAQFHQYFPTVPKSRLLALRIMASIGEQTAMESLLNECTKIKEHHYQAEIVNILHQTSSENAEMRQKKIAHWWKNLPEPSSDLQRYQRKKRSENQSVGVFIGNFNVHSPVMWFHRMFELLDQMAVDLVIYLEGADFWGRRYCETNFTTVVDIAHIDRETLSCILVRDAHDVLLDLTDFTEYSHYDITSSLDVPVVGLAADKAHMRQKNRLGLDKIITYDDLCNNNGDNNNRLLSLRKCCFLPTPEGIRWQDSHAEDFVIALALLPHQLKQAIPVLEALIQADERICLQIAETTLGDFGCQKLLQEVKRGGVKNFDERLFASEQTKFVDNNDFIKHLSSADLYLSTGVTGYDYYALKCAAPMVLMPDVSFAHKGYSEDVLRNFDLPQMFPKDTEQLVAFVRQMLSSQEAREEWVLEYHQHLETLTEPTYQFQRLVEFSSSIFQA